MQSLSSKFIVIFLLILTCSILISCATTANSSRSLAIALRHTDSIGTNNNTLPYLAVRSKCPAPPSIRIVNAETNEKELSFYKWWPDELYVTPKILMDGVVIYMSDAFTRTGIKTDQNSTKVIQVSMEEIKSWYTAWNFSARTKLKIMIPENNYTKIYEHYDSTPQGPQMAAAYTMREITRKIINDPFVQDYLLCANTSAMGGSFTGEMVLDILKKRYANGEITKDQYEQIKKDIQ